AEYSARKGAMISSQDLERIIGVSHDEPHRVLGPHAEGRGITVRVFRPDAAEVRVLPDADLAPRFAARVHPAGVFDAQFPEAGAPFPYRVEVRGTGGEVVTFRDPYAFSPVLGDVDYHLFAE